MINDSFNRPILIRNDSIWKKEEGRRRWMTSPGPLGSLIPRLIEPLRRVAVSGDPGGSGDWTRRHAPTRYPDGERRLMPIKSSLGQNVNRPSVISNGRERDFDFEFGWTAEITTMYRGSKKHNDNSRRVMISQLQSIILSVRLHGWLVI